MKPPITINKSQKYIWVAVNPNITNVCAIYLSRKSTKFNMGQKVYLLPKSGYAGIRYHDNRFLGYFIQNGYNLNIKKAEKIMKDIVNQ